jgi:hypothetical protein
MLLAHAFTSGVCVFFVGQVNRKNASASFAVWVPNRHARITDIIAGIDGRGAVTALARVPEKLVTDDRAFLQDPLQALSPFFIPSELAGRGGYAIAKPDPGNEFAWRLENNEELLAMRLSFFFAQRRRHCKR